MISPNKLTSVCECVGQALEDECQMRFYERECPGLLNYIKDKYHHKSCGAPVTYDNYSDTNEPLQAALWDMGTC